MITPRVKEQPLHLEPVTPDPFIVGLGSADRPVAGREPSPPTLASMVRAGSGD